MTAPAQVVPLSLPHYFCRGIDCPHRTWETAFDHDGFNGFTPTECFACGKWVNYVEPMRGEIRGCCFCGGSLTKEVDRRGILLEGVMLLCCRACMAAKGLGFKAPSNPRPKS